MGDKKEKLVDVDKFMSDCQNIVNIEILNG